MSHFFNPVKSGTEVLQIVPGIIKTRMEGVLYLLLWNMTKTVSLSHLYDLQVSGTSNKLQYRVRSKLKQ